MESHFRHLGRGMGRAQEGDPQRRKGRQDAKGAKNLGLVEPRAELDDLAHRVIGAAIEVHRLLGPGFLESVYEEALCVELALRGIEFARQVPVGVEYKGN